MGKLGENVPLLIDKAVDFMASSQAFREYLKKLPPRNAIPSGIPDESVPLYLQRLEYYRRVIRPEAGAGAVSRRCLLLKGFF
ncbi:hypothetical protein ACLBR5_03615 [Escherichia coli]